MPICTLLGPLLTGENECSTHCFTTPATEASLPHVLSLVALGTSRRPETQGIPVLARSNTARTTSWWWHEIWTEPECPGLSMRYFSDLAHGVHSQFTCYPPGQHWQLDPAHRSPLPPQSSLLQRERCERDEKRAACTGGRANEALVLDNDTSRKVRVLEHRNTAKRRRIRAQAIQPPHPTRLAKRNTPQLVEGPPGDFVLLAFMTVSMLATPPADILSISSVVPKRELGSETHKYSANLWAC